MTEYEMIKHMMDSPGWPVFIKELQELIDSYKMMSENTDIQFKRDWYLAKAIGLEEALNLKNKWLKGKN